MVTEDFRFEQQIKMLRRGPHNSRFVEFSASFSAR
jgi:hypothetical protein